MLKCHTRRIHRDKLESGAMKKPELRSYQYFLGALTRAVNGGPDGDAFEHETSTPKPVSASAPAARPQERSVIEEHRSAQSKTEKQARQLRCAHGCALNSAQKDWPKADKDMLAEFTEAQMQSRPLPSASLFRLASFF